MNNEQETHETETSNEPATNQQETTSSEGGEFKLTVRKLEMPVRPRGVLAE
jgi:hypothetical protein